MDDTFKIKIKFLRHVYQSNFRLDKIIQLLILEHFIFPSTHKFLNIIGLVPK